jgi:glycine/D-amino acid oxidase-like deaminating enzyme
MKHFVIVGAGLAGLTAANALADTGAKVTVVEQSHEPGGRARTRQVGGYSLNLGPHALYQGGAAARALSKWNIPFSGGNPGGKEVEKRSVLVRGDEILPAPQDLRTLLSTNIFCVREKLELACLLGSLTIGRAARNETVSQWMNRKVHLERVREYAEMLIRVSNYSVDFCHLSARAALRQVSLALRKGILYLDGGWQTLVDGLVGRARSLGVEFVYGKRLTRLDEFRAEGMVLAVAPEVVEQITGIRLPTRRASYVACLDICLSTWDVGAPTVAFALDRPLYYSVHSAVARLASEGGAVIHIAKYLRDEERDHVALRSELEEYADQLMPRWRNYADYVQFLPRLQVSVAIPGTSGRASENCRASTR